MRWWQPTLLITIPLSFNPEHNSLTDRHQVHTFFRLLAIVNYFSYLTIWGNVRLEIFHMSL